jgi:ubiquinone/menaquinone biosynthesis C-methylase UbiE
MTHAMDEQPERSETASPAECPICGTVAPSFLALGPRKLVPDRKCPTCGSLERHRQLWLFFEAETNLFTDRLRMLHIAPERCIATRLHARKNIDYLSADLIPSWAMVHMDLTDIHFPAETFDVIYASHVLEHVPDDRLAMRELYRVLRCGGWAILQVPIWRPRTNEDPTVTDPAERERRFGQSDHVRMYGHDGVYEQRLREAGFDVSVNRFARELSSETVRRYRLREAEDIYLVTKPSDSASRNRLSSTRRELEFRIRRGAQRLHRRVTRGGRRQFLASRSARKTAS